MACSFGSGWNDYINCPLLNSTNKDDNTPIDSATFAGQGSLPIVQLRKVKMKNNRTLIIVVIAVIALCLLAACIGAYMLFRRGQQAVGQVYNEVVGTVEAGATLVATSIPSGLQETAAAMATGLPGLQETAAALATSIPSGQEPNTPGGNSYQVIGAGPVLYLAGRSDITIPPVDQPSDITLFACRPEGKIQESFPPGYRISPGAEFTIQASGRINYYGGPEAEGYLPDGDSSTADIFAFGGISGYYGPAGALAGVFLDDNIPNGTPPDRLDFTNEGLGHNFDRLQPGLGQVFFIGDGANSVGVRQVFLAPPGATRLFIGLVDSAAFSGDPSCYTDNLGSYTFEIHSNMDFSAIP